VILATDACRPGRPADDTHNGVILYVHGSALQQAEGRQFGRKLRDLRED
jgi:hypothetical protein